MKRSDIINIILAIGGVIILSSTALIIYLNVPIKSASASTQISNFTRNASKVEINTQVPVGNIFFIEMNQASSNIIEVKWDIKYSGYYLPQQCIITKYTVQDTKIKILIDTQKNIDIDSLNLKIFFNPMFLYSFISNTEVGNINFNAFNVEIKDFFFKSTSGELNIKLNKSLIYGDFRLSSDTGKIKTTLDHLVFSNNFVCNSNTGVQLHDIWNVKFNSIADINLNSNNGYIQFYWANHFIKSNNVNLNVYSNTDFRVKIWCPLSIMRSQVSLSTITGSKVFIKPVGSFEEVDENFYQTSKIDDSSLDCYNITATSNYGQLRVQFVNCFKWSRICDYTQDFLPYNVNSCGNHTLTDKHYAINSVDFFNVKYIYLNETRSLPVSYQPLPSTSENLVFIDWEINYVHAMGIGVGKLDVKIVNYIKDDRFLIYLALDFALDRILPTFNKCNFTVYYNPNYNFNHD